MIQTLVVEGELPGLNEFLSWAKQRGFKKGTVIPGAPYSAAKRLFTNKIALLARVARLKPVTHPVIVRFTWFAANKRRDKDNLAAGGRKVILDGLEQAGVLPRDNWQWIAGFEDRFEIDRKNPRTEVVIEEVG